MVVMPDSGVLPPLPRKLGTAKNWDEHNKERFQHQEELIQNMMQRQYIISMMHVTIFKYSISPTFKQY
jgi:hypothetical protein